MGGVKDQLNRIYPWMSFQASSLSTQGFLDAEFSCFLEANKTKPKVASLFSGALGLELGLRPSLPKIFSILNTMYCYILLLLQPSDKTMPYACKVGGMHRLCPNLRYRMMQEIFALLTSPIVPICKVERSEFCRSLIEQRIRDGVADPAPLFSDVTKVHAKDIGPCAGITAGFPCQAG